MIKTTRRCRRISEPLAPKVSTQLGDGRRDKDYLFKDGGAERGEWGAVPRKWEKGATVFF